MDRYEQFFGARKRNADKVRESPDRDPRRKSGREPRELVFWSGVFLDSKRFSIRSAVLSSKEGMFLNALRASSRMYWLESWGLFLSSAICTFFSRYSLDRKNKKFHFIFKTERKASCGMSTLPTLFILFLPSFCFSSSLRFLLTSPP